MLEHARKLIQLTLETAQKPAAMVSGGKDSQVMLHLLREQLPDIPVIYFRGFQHPTKHKFIESQATLIEPLPFMRDAIGDESGRVQIIEVFNPKLPVHFPLEASEDFTPNASSHCAIEKLREPVSAEPWEYDALFSGHRNDDVDPFWGGIPLKAERYTFNNVQIAYPLAEMSESDIWSISETLGVAQNRARYDGDLSANNDYYDLCTNCLKHGQEKSYCPRINNFITNISKQAGVVEQKKVWQQALVNLGDSFYAAH